MPKTYVITRKQLIAGLNRISPSLPKLIQDDLKRCQEAKLFEAGAGMEQFRHDFVDRDFLCWGKRLYNNLSKEEKTALSDKQIKDDLSRLYGGEENAEMIPQAATQFIVSIIHNLILAKIKHSMTPDQFLKSCRPPKYEVDLILSEKKNEKEKKNAILTCTYPAILFFSTEQGKENEVIAHLKGPITAQCLLTKENGKVGYALESISTEDETVFNMLRNNTFYNLSKKGLTPEKPELSLTSRFAFYAATLAVVGVTMALNNSAPRPR